MSRFGAFHRMSSYETYGNCGEDGSRAAPSEGPVTCQTSPQDTKGIFLAGLNIQDPGERANAPQYDKLGELDRWR